MTRPSTLPTLRLALACGLVLSLGACGNMAERLANVGAPPPLSRIDDPTEQRGYKPVSLPMPPPDASTRADNSLWRAGARQFFKDARAARVGDILTVNVAVADSATVNNSTTTTRDNKENAGIPNFLGLETTAIGRAFEGITPSTAVGINSQSSAAGTGKVDRKESISLKVAAVVTQVLPNGNLVIQGRQEVRVNAEVRELLVSGVVRPEDISAVNTINHTQIAEARVSYGGRGAISDMQQPRYGQQLFDIIFPW